jgi:hypothetical protein
MRLTQDDDMIQTLAPDRSDQPFGKAILPRRGRRGRLPYRENQCTVAAYNSSDNDVGRRRGKKMATFNSYSYCVKCGRIEATSEQTPLLSAPHRKPYPDERDPTCEGGGTTRHIVLGTDFITDVALLSIDVATSLNLKPGQYPTDVALRTISEAIAKAGSQMLEIEPGELSWRNIGRRLRLRGARAYTGGWGHFHIPDDLFLDLRAYRAPFCASYRLSL